jgi:hypothetical protein
MAEIRKLAAILCSDVVGYSRLAAADEDRILARLRALRSDLIDPTIAVHNGRIVKRTGDGAIVEFRSVVDAVRCAIEVQNTMVERNAGVPCGRRQGDWGSTSDCFHPMRPQASFDHTSGSERPRDLAQRRPWARNGHFITEWSKVLGTRRLTGSMTKNSSAFEVEEFNQLLDLKKSFSTFNRASVSL